MSIKVFDFFSGCGGTSSGLQSAGFEIVFALDNDESAISTFRQNFPHASTELRNIEEVGPEILSSVIGSRKDPILFCGCAPCQPFSKQSTNKKDNDPRINLLLEFSKFVTYWLPEYVLIENVPGMQKIKNSSPFEEFLGILEKNKYSFSYDVVPAYAYGVPQKRERLVLLASRLGKISLPKPTHGPSADLPYSTVRDWISGLPYISAGEKCDKDPDHQAARLSDINIQRIKATPEGRGRESWPIDLWLECHKGHKGHSDVYGRLHWDKPASGLTTKCISLSNGRFGHPIQDRAISLREAACLQTFPRNYKFYGSLQSKAKQVGNAVPPLMAKQLGEGIRSHLEAVQFGSDL